MIGRLKGLKLKSGGIPFQSSFTIQTTLFQTYLGVATRKVLENVASLNSTSLLQTTFSQDFISKTRFFATNEKITESFYLRKKKKKKSESTSKSKPKSKKDLEGTPKKSQFFRHEKKETTEPIDKKDFSFMKADIPTEALNSSDSLTQLFAKTWNQLLKKSATVESNDKESFILNEANESENAKPEMDDKNVEEDVEGEPPEIPKSNKQFEDFVVSHKQRKYIEKMAEDFVQMNMYEEMHLEELAEKGISFGYQPLPDTDPRLQSEYINCSSCSQEYSYEFVSIPYSNSFFFFFKTRIH